MAPKGCTQYYFGSNTGSVKTFNFDGNQHLANQHQAICIRREKGFCAACFHVENIATDFALSGPDDTTDKRLALNRPASCCHYGLNGLGSLGYDCAIILGAINKLASGGGNLFDRFCGRDKGLGKRNPMTVCSELLNCLTIHDN